MDMQNKVVPERSGHIQRSVLKKQTLIEWRIFLGYLTTGTIILYQQFQNSGQLNDKGYSSVTAGNSKERGWPEYITSGDQSLVRTEENAIVMTTIRPLQRWSLGRNVQRWSRDQCVNANVNYND